MYDVIPSLIKYQIVPTTAIFLISCYLQSTYIQATCSGVQPLVSVQVGLHFRSSMRYLARGRYPFLKLSINSKIELCKSYHSTHHNYYCEYRQISIRAQVCT